MRFHIPRDIDVLILRLASATVLTGMSLGYAGTEWRSHIESGTVYPALIGLVTTVIFLIVLGRLRVK